jgi:hypothetical protein
LRACQLVSLGEVSRRSVAPIQGGVGEPEAKYAKLIGVQRDSSFSALNDMDRMKKQLIGKDGTEQRSCRVEELSELEREGSFDGENGAVPEEPEGPEGA